MSVDGVPGVLRQLIRLIITVPKVSFYRTCFLAQEKAESVRRNTSLALLTTRRRHGVVTARKKTTNRSTLKEMVPVCGGNDRSRLEINGSEWNHLELLCSACGCIAITSKLETERPRGLGDPGAFLYW